MQPKILSITTRNQWFQRIESIKRNRKKRWQHRQFVVEDVRSINQLRQSRRWQVETLLYAPEQSLSTWAQDILGETSCRYHLHLSPELMQALSDKKNTAEIIALVIMPEIEDLSLPLPTQTDLILLLDRPSNPGNLGSIIRSCDAFGVNHLLMTGHAADPFDPVTVRATAGAFFNVALTRLSRREMINQWLTQARQRIPNLQVIGTSAKGTVRIQDCDFRQPTLLLMGNETQGLSHWLQEQSDYLTRFSMQGVATSLNVACATTAVLYEISRQREDQTN